MQFTPRAGTEVIVDFVNGDPDRPQIAGMLPNANNPLPFPTKDNPNISGIKTQTPGNPLDYNELSFDDTKGSQKINIQAQNTLNLTAKGKEQTTVEGNLIHTVTGDYAHNSHSSISYKAKNQLTVNAGAAQIQMTPSQMTVKTPNLSTGMPGNAASLPAMIPTYTKPQGSDQALSSQQQDQQNAEKLFYPSAKLSIDLGEVTLPPEKRPGITYEIKLSMSAELTADSENSMTEAEYQATENKIKLSLKGKVADLFENMRIAQIDPENGIMQINIQNVGTLTSSSFTLKGNQVHAAFTDNSVKTTYSHWKFSGSVTLKLVITIIPDQSEQSGESVYDFIKRHLEENLMIGLMVTEPQTFGTLLETHQTAIEQQPIAAPSTLRENIIAATLILTMVLLAPVGA